MSGAHVTPSGFPETLRRVAALVPDLLFLGTPEMDDTGGGEVGYWVRFPECRAFVGYGAHASEQGHLIMMLALACAARGLHWEVGPTRATASDWDRRRYTVSWSDFAAPDDYSPAHALALAFEQALGAGLGYRAQGGLL